MLVTGGRLEDQNYNTTANLLNSLVRGKDTIPILKYE